MTSIDFDPTELIDRHLHELVEKVLGDAEVREGAREKGFVVRILERQDIWGIRSEYVRAKPLWPCPCGGKSEDSVKMRMEDLLEYGSTRAEAQVKMILKIYKQIDECKLKHGSAVVVGAADSGSESESDGMDLAGNHFLSTPASYFEFLYKTLEERGEGEYRQYWDAYLWNKTRVTLGQTQQHALVAKGFVA